MSTKYEVHLTIIVRRKVNGRTKGRVEATFGPYDADSEMNVLGMTAMDASAGLLERIKEYCDVSFAAKRSGR